MIFDGHTHLMQLGVTPDVPDPTEVSLMLRRMDRCQVDRALLLGAVGPHGFDPTMEMIVACNDHTLAAVAQRPDRFSGMCYLNPAHPFSFCREELRRCIEHGPLVGVKLWVAVNARDSRLDPIVDVCEQLDCPLLYHAWYKTVGRVHQESDPSDIVHLAARHPKAKIIMAHLAGAGVRGVLDIAEHPNVCIDTSGGQPVAGLVEFAVEHLGIERVIYGSDWPVRDFAVQVGKLNIPGQSRSDRDAMAWKNLCRLLGERAPC